MSDLSRHIPVIALTVLFAVSMYYMYRSLTSVSHRVENLSQELYYGLNSVTELAAKLEGTSGSLQTEIHSELPQQSVAAVITPDDVLVSGIIPDDAQSVDSADIVISGGKASPERRTQKTQKTQKKESPSPVEQSFSSQVDNLDDVNAYIGKLEEKFVNRPDAGPETVNDDDDTASIGSEVSSISALNGKKRVPPYAARNFDLGHKEVYNGKEFSVIKTKSGSIRWSKATPLSTSDQDS